MLVDGRQLNFPPQQNGTTSTALPLTISNVGSANATLTSILTFGYFTQTNDCPGSLPPQTSCTAMVTVSPTANTTPSGDIGVVYGNGTRTDVYANFTPNSTDGPLLLSSDGYGLAYGNVLLGATSLLRTVTVTNSGTSPVTVNPPTLSGTGASNFTVSANTCSGIQLQPEASCVIGLVFQPTAVGRLAVPLLITGGSSSLTIYLVGTGITSPTLSVTPASADLGNVVLGASATQVLQVLNNSGAALTLTSVVAGMADGSAQTDFSQQNNCPLTFASQATCTITVTFAPSNNGLRKGAVSLIVNGGVLNQTVSITGTGLPVFAATPTTLTFATPVGSSSLQSVTLLNQSSSAQSFSLTLTSPFAIDSTTCVSPLAAGAQCVVSVSFEPTSAGLQTSALTTTLTGIPPEAVNLTGTGTTPNATLSSNTLVFGRTVQGLASAAQTITLTNSGSAPLGSLALTLSGANAADFSFTTTCGSSIAADQACSIAVVFKPSLLTSESATLNLASNAPGSPASIALSGTGAAPDFYVTTPSASTAVTAGTPATFNLTIQTDPGLTGTVTFGCSGLPDYAACTFAPVSVPLTGNATSVLTVSTSQTQTQSAAVATPTIARFEAVSVAALLFLPFVRRRPCRALFGFLLVSVLMGLSGCSSSSSPGASNTAPVTHITPKGTYTFTVTQSSATISHTLPLTLTVQ